MVASVGLQSMPGIGDVYSSLTGPVGYDAIAGVSLSGTGPPQIERVFKRARQDLSARDSQDRGPRLSKAFASESSSRGRSNV
jgi:hypothetical protein